MTDPSPHRRGKVVVGGVAVPYLDWGGSGTGLAFIPGLGNSAHVFDDFALRFTDRFHVIGVTRIGFGESDQPQRHGYDIVSRVAHIRAALDSSGVARAVLVGHSLGGDEITAFAVAHPERVVALVYLDAAIDHTVTLKWQQVFGQFFAAAPEASASDRANATAYRAFIRRLQGMELPIGEVLATTRFDSAGVARGARAPPRVFASTIAAATPPEFARIRAPALALYSDQTVADIMPWVLVDSVRTTEAASIVRDMLQELRVERARFVRAVPTAQQFTYRAHHYQFLTVPDDTEHRMRAFFSSIGLR